MSDCLRGYGFATAAALLSATMGLFYEALCRGDSSRYARSAACAARLP